MAAVQGSAALSAGALLTVPARVSPDGLWAAYQAAWQAANAAWEKWGMFRQAGGSSGQAGLLYSNAYRLEVIAEQARVAWQAADAQEFPGARG